MPLANLEMLRHVVGWIAVVSAMTWISSASLAIWQVREVFTHVIHQAVLWNREVDTSNESLDRIADAYIPDMTARLSRVRPIVKPAMFVSKHLTIIATAAYVGMRIGM